MREEDSAGRAVESALEAFPTARRVMDGAYRLPDTPGLREEIGERLAGLVAGSVDPSAVEDWALRRMAGDAPELHDGSVWTALDRLAGAGLRDERGGPLHSRDDFTAWLADYRENRA
ncbi:hypothetical protein [Streptomyces sp. RFCAC02]|uniref:hypothetical protein n=1 Tax=Streptomyces sp. RFCAC02 TaxID=2499143 RepID=UPI00101F4792|nr:hypothetical protein [Streptomyces sp. RFCAC02]